MQKIVDLLKNLKASPELVKEITEGLEAYKADVKAKYDSEFKDKTAAARRVCIEAVEQEKKDMARKVEIFLEARVATITREAQKQAAIGETRATKTLRELSALLEGVKIDGTSEDHQAAVTERNKLRAVVHQLQEACEKEKLKATRANTIAMKLLQRQQFEAKAPKQATAVTESTNKSVQSVKAPAKQTLQELKSSKATPITTRPITEAKARIEASDPEVQKIADAVSVVP